MLKRVIAVCALVTGALLAWRALRRRPAQSLRDRVIVITGASSGIGRAAALAFAAEGARVVLVARRAGALEEVRCELGRYGVPVLVVPADVACDADLETLVARVLAAFGRIDVLVNNAGLACGGPFDELEPARLRALVDVNVYGQLRLAQLIVPVMRRQGGGHIVNVSSMAGIIAAPGQVAYGTTRRAVIAFSDGLRRELDGAGIYVSTILPGWTRTPMTGAMPERALRASGLLLPVERFVDAEVPAAAIVDAVRHRRRQVRIGGAQMMLGEVGERLAPWLIDLFFRWTVDREKALDSLRGLGT